MGTLIIMLFIKSVNMKIWTAFSSSGSMWLAVIPNTTRPSPWLDTAQAYLTSMSNTKMFFASLNSTFSTLLGSAVRLWSFVLSGLSPLMLHVIHYSLELIISFCKSKASLLPNEIDLLKIRKNASSKS